MSAAIPMQASIYVHTERAREELVQDIARLLQANIVGTYDVEDKNNQYDISIRRTKGAAKYREKINLSDFHYFCYYLDYAPEDDVDEQVSVQTVTKILKFFWQNNIPAVAECSYSEKLPMNGGDSPEALWPN